MLLLKVVSHLFFFFKSRDVDHCLHLRMWNAFYVSFVGDMTEVERN